MNNNFYKKLDFNKNSLKLKIILMTSIYGSFSLEYNKSGKTKKVNIPPSGNKSFKTQAKQSMIYVK